MNDRDISSREELDAALAGNAMRREEKLWKAAEGRTFVWGDVIGALLGGIVLAAGIYETMQQADGVLLFALGIGLIGSTMYRRQQAQINALRKLLKEADGRTA